jgi:hypothetical protein
MATPQRHSARLEASKPHGEVISSLEELEVIMLYFKPPKKAQVNPRIQAYTKKHDLNDHSEAFYGLIIRLAPPKLGERG